MPDWTSSKTSRMPCLCARALQFVEEGLRGNHVAAFALDRLNENGRDFLGGNTRPEQQVFDLRTH